ncbi:hypothetical protein DFJ73DRAFT_810753 [Zopfochytrium polystomum]|nr:hypothetical protein DFJ73DRAFT_810753 [Zopfochytrium polystomum]
MERKGGIFIPPHRRAAAAAAAAAAASPAAPADDTGVISIASSDRFLLALPTSPPSPPHDGSAPSTSNSPPRHTPDPRPTTSTPFLRATRSAADLSSTNSSPVTLTTSAPIKRGRGTFRAPSHLLQPTTPEPAPVEPQPHRSTAALQQIRVYPPSKPSSSAKAIPRPSDRGAGQRPPGRPLSMSALADDLARSSISPPKVLDAAAAGGASASSPSPADADSGDEDGWETNADSISVRVSPRKGAGRAPPATEPAKLDWTGTRTIECFDFPTRFKTEDVIDVFRECVEDASTIRIKWISDSRAYVTFQSESIAKRAYAHSLSHPFVKVKPSTESPEDRTEDNSPRPVKTDSVARRLIAGALGVRPKKKTESELELERLKFQQAQEQRDLERMERKAREARAEAAWND